MNWRHSSLIVATVLTLAGCATSPDAAPVKQASPADSEVRVKAASAADSEARAKAAQAEAAKIADLKKAREERTAEEQRKIMSQSFEVTSASVQNKVAMFGGITIDPGKEGMTTETGTATPLHGRVFVVVSWCFKDYKAPMAFKVPTDMMSLQETDGHSMEVVARAQMYAVEAGKLIGAWAPGAESSYAEGDKVEGTWLFSVPKDSVEKLQFNCLGRVVRCPVSKALP